MKRDLWQLQMRQNRELSSFTKLSGFLEHSSSQSRWMDSWSLHGVCQWCVKLWDFGLGKLMSVHETKCIVKWNVRRVIIMSNVRTSACDNLHLVVFKVCIPVGISSSAASLLCFLLARKQPQPQSGSSDWPKRASLWRSCAWLPHFIKCFGPEADSCDSKRVADFEPFRPTFFWANSHWAFWVLMSRWRFDQTQRVLRPEKGLVWSEWNPHCWPVIWMRVFRPSGGSQDHPKWVQTGSKGSKWHLPTSTALKCFCLTRV